MFDPNSNPMDSEYQSPNGLLKHYLDKGQVFPYGQESVQTLINFSNEATKVIANVGCMVEGMVKEQRLVKQELIVLGDTEAATKFDEMMPRLVRMNDDLKALCVSFNAMAATLILTAKQVEMQD
jgi:hypothetical protein